MTNLIENIISKLQLKYRYAKMFADVTREMNIYIKKLNYQNLDTLIAKRQDIIKAIEVVDRDIKSYVNIAPVNIRSNLLTLLSNKTSDPKSQISKEVKKIYTEMKRAYILDKENQQLLKKLNKE